LRVGVEKLSEEYADAGHAPLPALNYGLLQGPWRFLVDDEYKNESKIY
jgi:hypothetical protein